MKQILLGIMLSITLLIFAACGGGGDSVAPPAKTSATFKITLSGSLGSSAISGAGFTVTLPANVTPATTSGTTVAANVVTLSGIFSGSTIAPVVTYTPAAVATPGSLQVTAASSAPAGAATVGDIVTITLQLANGAAPATADFPLSSVSVIDTLGAPIAGISAAVSGLALQ